MDLPGYEAALRAAGVIDRSGTGRITVRGKDRLAWLQGLLTNDVAGLAAGQGCYAAILTPQGRMIADLRLLALDDEVRLDVPAAVKDSLLRRLDMYVISEDVRVEDATETIARVAVHGPAAARVVTAATGTSAGAEGTQSAGGDVERLDGLPEDWHVTRSLAARTGQAAADAVLVAANRTLGTPGFDLYVPRGLAVALHGALTAAGAAPLAERAFEVLRIEAGRPAFGSDLDAETIPLEAGLEDRAISFTKGCYVGQEIIVRVRDRGHGRVARRLVGLAGPQAGPGEPGEAACATGDTLVAGGREVGQVTSAAFSPTCGRTIALGYVHRDLAEPGTAVTARRAGADVPLVVSALPFVHR